MKKNPTFRLRVMQSTYFRPEGNESLATVVHDFGDPVKMPTVYMHMQRHQAKDLISARKRFEQSDKLDVHHTNDKLAKTAAVVESEIISRGAHEVALDEFIKEGHEKLLRKEMPISATNFLQALKIKSDNEKNTKDRRLDMIKSFFTGAKSDG
jgi:hypothetical protein